MFLNQCETEISLVQQRILMDETLERSLLAVKRSAVESRTVQVERFLKEVLEQVSLNIEGLRKRIPNFKQIGEGKIQCITSKQVHFSSPLVTETYSQQEDEQTQDTIILCSDEFDDEDVFDNEGGFDNDEDEDEVRRKIVEECDSFVPEFNFCPVKDEPGFGNGNLLFSTVSCHDLRHDSNILVAKQKSVGSPSPDQNKEEAWTSTANCCKNDVLDTMAVVPDCDKDLGSKSDFDLEVEEERKGLDISLHERCNHGVDEENIDNAQILEGTNLDLQDAKGVGSIAPEDGENAKRKLSPSTYRGSHDTEAQTMPKSQDSYDTGKENDESNMKKENTRIQIEKFNMQNTEPEVKTTIIPTGESVAGTRQCNNSEKSGALIEDRGQTCHKSEAFCRKSIIPGEEFSKQIERSYKLQEVDFEMQMKVAKEHLENLGNEILMSVAQAEKSETKSGNLARHNGVSMMKSGESRDNLCEEGAYKKRKFGEISTLICNGEDLECNNEVWQAEVMRKKNRQTGSDIDIDKLKTELGSYTQLDIEKSIEGSCIRSISPMYLDDQLVPNEVPDSSNQTSAARMVLSSLNPQPYSETFSPISHSLLPGHNILESVVPGFDGLKHVTQVCDVDSSELEQNEEGKYFAKDLNYNLENLGMEMIISDDSDVCMVSSADTCHDGSKLQPSTQTNAEISCDKELKGTSITEDPKNKREQMAVEITCNDFMHSKEDQVIEKADTCEIKSLKGPGEFTLERNWDVGELENEKREGALFVSKRHDAEDPLRKFIGPTIEIKKGKTENEMDAKEDAQNGDGSVEVETIDNLKEGKDSFERLEKDEKNREEGIIITEYEEERGTVVKYESEMQEMLAASVLEDPSEVRYVNESVTNLQETTGNISKDILASQNCREAGNSTVLFEREDNAMVSGKGNGDKEEEQEEDKDDLFDGSEGFDVSFFSNDIYKSMKNEDKSAEKLLHDRNPKSSLENGALKRPVTELERTFDVIRGEFHDATSIVQDQMVETATSTDCSDAKFYNDDEWDRLENPDTPVKSMTSLAATFSNDKEDAKLTSQVPKSSNSTGVFIWPIKDHSMEGNSQNSDVQALSSKHAPSQSILRLGLSRHKQVKRLHPYFDKNKLKSDRQVVPDIERNLEQLDVV